MGRHRKHYHPAAHGLLPVLGAVGGAEDYEVEADDGYDLVEFLRTAKQFGRAAFLETDADFYG